MATLISFGDVPQVNELGSRGTRNAMLVVGRSWCLSRQIALLRLGMESEDIQRNSPRGGVTNFKYHVSSALKIGISVMEVAVD